MTPLDDAPSDSSPELPGYLKRKLGEVVERQTQLEGKISAHARLVQVAVDNTHALLKRSDPLSWVRRGLILGLCSALGSGVAAAVVHTMWLAYFARR